MFGPALAPVVYFERFNWMAATQDWTSSSVNCQEEFWGFWASGQVWPAAETGQMRPGLGAGDVGSSPGPALLYSVSLSKGLCSVVFQFSEILSKRSAWLAQKAIIGFNICRWQWNILISCQVFDLCKILSVWKVSTLLLSLLIHWSVKIFPDVEAAPRHHAGFQVLMPRKLPPALTHIKSIITFALEGIKSVHNSEQKYNCQLASLGLWTIGNRTQQNFSDALFSGAHLKPSRKESEPKTSLGI